MTEQPTTLDVRSRLFTEGVEAYDYAKTTYGNTRKADGPAFDAYVTLTSVAALKHAIAAILRRVTEDHGEQYAATITALVLAGEDDGETVYDANDDLFALTAAASATNTTGA